MSIDVEDTIAAIATPAGPAARGIVRISGPRMMDCLSGSLTWSGDPPTGNGRPFVQPAQIHCPAPIGDLSAQVYVWPTKRSYTRQPAAEIHLPGNLLLLDSVLAVLRENGARLAAAGEFTLRAFLAGRMDLAQVEGLLGVIHAVTPEQLAPALDQLAAGLSGPLRQLHGQLLELLAHLEAGLDFVEEDIEFISPELLEQQLSDAIDCLHDVAQQFKDRRVEAPVCRIVLYGAANAGKSTLFNNLIGEDEALVSRQPGTTRDYICRPMQLGRLSCLLIDTAGKEERDQLAALECRAQQLAEDQVQQADLALLCVDGSRAPSSVERELLDRSSDDVLVVLTKSDLGVHSQLESLGIAVSAQEGVGLGELRRLLEERVTLSRSAAAGNHRLPLLCAEAIRRAEESLAVALRLTLAAGGEELIAAELRGALDGLGQVLGQVYSDDILDRVFSRFCIGK